MQISLLWDWPVSAQSFSIGGEEWLTSSILTLTGTVTILYSSGSGPDFIHVKVLVLTFDKLRF